MCVVCVGKVQFSVWACEDAEGVRYTLGSDPAAPWEMRNYLHVDGRIRQSNALHTLCHPVAVRKHRRTSPGPAHDSVPTLAMDASGRSGKDIAFGWGFLFDEDLQSLGKVR